MSVLTVYDIEAEVEAAVTALLNTQLIALSTQDPQQFQKDRARVEVEAVVGAGFQKHLAMTETTGLETEVEDAWELKLMLEMVTGASIAIHSGYRANVRYIMSRLPALVNGTPGGLVNHVIYGPMRHLGSSPLLSPQKGYYLTKMDWGTVVSVHPSAWAKLSAP